MAKYSEETINNWRQPASESEEQKISNAITMIKDAINAHEILKPLSTEFVIQGSYGNNTNIRVDSDIDVCVMLKETFYTNYPDCKTDSDYGFKEGTNSFTDYRKWIVEALNKKFGKENVDASGNKSIKVHSNTYRVQADVVPAFQYRNYQYDKSNDADNFIEGIKFFALQGEEVINYPKIHVENGITKNTNTGRSYKRAVRLYKRIRNRMIEDKLPVPESIRSFLIEGLLWNTPDSIFNNAKTWNDLLRNSILHIYKHTKDEELSKDWGEVSEHFYLFHNGRKWNREHVAIFLTQMWKYLEYQ
jgi:Nucleotidyltransferase domain